ncbi:MAG: PadR family transcriptional regulator [Frankiales bacterium]|nr:PadR family transcriptional regulator [Frankiales bacterium]
MTAHAGPCGPSLGGYAAPVPPLARLLAAFAGPATRGTADPHESVRGFAGPDLDDAVRRLRAHMTGRRGHPGPRGPWGRGAPWAPWAPGGAGGWPFGPEAGPRRPRAGRGDVRTAILALLWEEPRHGYQIIQDITERSGGAWRPSPGSVYPALSALQDEGFVDDEKVEGRRVFSLTEAGRAHVAERADDLAHVFDANSAGTEDEDVTDLRTLLFSVGAAAVQVVTTGSPDQVAAARRVLSAARRDLYLLLAEDDTEDGTEDEA